MPDTTIERAILNTAKNLTVAVDTNDEICKANNLKLLKRFLVELGVNGNDTTICGLAEAIVDGYENVNGAR